MTGEHDAGAWVVVGVDGSTESDAAVRYGVREARRRGAGLRLVHGMPAFPEGLAVSVLAGEASAPTGRALLRAASAIAHDEDGDVPVECCLRAGDRCLAILEAAGDAVEIVLGHDPTPTLSRLATGSTVIGVAARAPVPVIAVGPGQATGPTTGQHGIVVVGIKHPQESDAMLRWGFAVAAERNASVRFLHAWELPAGYEGLAATQAERDELSRRTAEPIERALGALAAEYPGVEHRLDVTPGHPGRLLAEASRSCDLLVLARREHLLPRGHIGGTARALLHHAACPVMVVPPGAAAATSGAVSPASASAS